MSQSPQTAYQQNVYGTLNLYEALLNLCFHVQHRHIASTEADNLYINLGLKEALQDCLDTVAESLSEPPPQLLPGSISGMSEAEYVQLQGYFGVIKTHAKEINAHAAEIKPEIQSFIDDAETVLNGGRLETNVLLSESKVDSYHLDTKTLTVNDSEVVFEGVQEDYFLWGMFRYPSNMSVSWDELYDDIKEHFRDEQVFSQSRDSMRQAMHRINRRIKKCIGTKNNLFTYKSGGFKRHYGPAPE